jgi:hypothetical protein
MRNAFEIALVGAMLFGLWVRKEPYYNFPFK